MNIFEPDSRPEQPSHFEAAEVAPRRQATWEELVITTLESLVYEFGDSIGASVMPLTSPPLYTPLTQVSQPPASTDDEQSYDELLQELSPTTKSPGKVANLAMYRAAKEALNKAYQAASRGNDRRAA